MTIAVTTFAEEIEALRKDIIVASNEVNVRPIHTEKPINGFHEVIKAPLEAPAEGPGWGKRIAIAWIWGLGVSLVFAGGWHLGANAEAAKHTNRPPVHTQVGSIETTIEQPPAWVDPDLGE
jgi:hypothetical protein